MISISTTHQPATDLGYLMHKNPGRIHTGKTGAGRAWVAFPVASDERCTAVVGLDVDPVALVRGKGAGQGTLGQYVNDRPYVVSSLYCTALTVLLGTAMSGRSKERQELAETPIPLEVEIPAMASDLSDAEIIGLFVPLGYEVTVSRRELDPEFPEWGTGRPLGLKLVGKVRLQDLLQHLYVLIGTMDSSKHYYVDRDEVDKLVRKGEGWVETHPMKQLIVRRYLGRRPSLVADALERLADEEPELALESSEAGQSEEESHSETEESGSGDEKTVRLHELRHRAVLRELKDSGATSVLDLGCGDGYLLKKLLKVGQFKRIVGMDVAFFELQKAARKLRMEKMPPSMAERIDLIHGSLLYRDPRLAGFDAAAVVEVIEHLDEARLGFFENVVFEFAKPKTVVVTTPNREWNATFEEEGDVQMRHSDHRFEWTRAEFGAWGAKVAEKFGYSFEKSGIGEEHEEFGCPSQMGVFRR